MTIITANQKVDIKHNNKKFFSNTKEDRKWREKEQRTNESKFKK